MTIGGNDIGFAPIAMICVLSVFKGCQALFEDVRFLGLVDQAVPILAMDALRRVERALNSETNLESRRGPAPLLVLAYPNPMPFFSARASDCAGIIFSPGEIEFFGQLVLHLNAALKTAVRQLKSEGRPVYFVDDTVDAFQPDHTLCSGDSYVNQLDAGSTAAAIGSKILHAFRKFRHFVATSTAVKLASPLLDDVVQELDAVRRFQEQLHPTSAGYQAVTARLVRWSASPSAHLPVTRKDGVDNRYTGGPIATFKADFSEQAPSSTIDLQPGSTVVIQGSGVDPHSPAILVLRSAPLPLDSAVADGAGKVTLRATIPEGTRIGSHNLEVRGVKQDGSRLVYRRSIDVARGRPWWTWLLLAAALAGVIMASLSARALGYIKPIRWRERRRADQ
jgi:hypothetical protein